MAQQQHVHLLQQAGTRSEQVHLDAKDRPGSIIMSTEALAPVNLSETLPYGPGRSRCESHLSLLDSPTLLLPSIKARLDTA